ncbi:hypothetical protein KJS94_01900 [Flavihumibacter rivuli]|uniref:hypothetical protein n=1 Tax=Flavihumibacter rivuli TaxID=2838156 RepID=UPI001BDE60AA|nr:hypothetical protein [Flavihumibacter rivuli]ULQ56948.1 hypothetical protein KJS94_01900 [Flavihumibacter rivuli]
MKKLLAALVVFTSLTGCLKTVENKTGRVLVPLQITGAQTPAETVPGSRINARVSVKGSNKCYEFVGFDVRSNVQNTYDIRAYGSYPADTSNLNCGTGLFQLDTAFSLPLYMEGKYVIRYYNDMTLLKADTVTVRN